MKLRYQILFGYAAPITLSIISAVTVYSSTQALRTEQTKTARTTKVAEDIGRLGVELQTVSRAARGYLLDKDNSSRRSFDSARGEIEQNLKQLETIIVDPEQKKFLGQIRNEAAELLRLNGELMALVDSGKTPEAVARWKSDKGRNQSETLSKTFDDFQARQEKIVEENSQAQSQAIDFLVTTVIGTAILTLILSVGIALWIVAAIARQMNATANVLASSSSEIAATIEEQERTASGQAASVSETTATMDELGASSRQSAEQAEAASAATGQVLQLTQEGNRAVGQTLQGMEDLRQKVGAIAEQIVRLSEQTGQIGNISQLVTDLANQTNMLALNAAVEAVRAGEHGKGFAVVAAEIRKLADQSKQSAQKINTLVGEIQASIDSTVMVTDEGTKTVASGMDTSQRTAATFEEMARAIDGMALNNQQISLNIRQQSVAIQQVVQAMAMLDRGAQQTAEGIRQTRIGTEQLNVAARDLQQLV